MESVKVGIVRSSFISGIYLENSKIFSSFDVVTCADLIMERAEGRAKEYVIQKACSTEEVMDDHERARPQPDHVGWLRRGGPVCYNGSLGRDPYR